MSAQVGGGVAECEGERPPPLQQARLLDGRGSHVNFVARDLSPSLLEEIWPRRATDWS